jgi:hypothetical protein
MGYSIRRDSRVIVYEVAAGSGQDPVKRFCEHTGEWSGSITMGFLLLGEY